MSTVSHTYWRIELGDLGKRHLAKGPFEKKGNLVLDPIFLRSSKLLGYIECTEVLLSSVIDREATSALLPIFPLPTRNTCFY